jgi:hypothetical protein
LPGQPSSNPVAPVLGDGAIANAYSTSHWVNNTYQTGQHFYWTGNLIDITAFHNAGQS